MITLDAGLTPPQPTGDDRFVVQVTRDKWYLANYPERAYGFQIVDADSGSLYSWHYHGYASEENARTAGERRAAELVTDNATITNLRERVRTCEAECERWKRVAEQALGDAAKARGEG